MAPVAAVSRPPGRPKLRSKIDGKLGLPALYTARNLDLCTRQLDHWNPFASSAAASPDHNVGALVTDDATVVRNNVGLQHERNPNLGIGTTVAHPMLASAFRSVAVSPDCGQFPVGSQLYQRCEGGQRGFDPLPNTFGEPAAGWFKRAAYSSSEKGVFEFGKVSATECDVRVVQQRRVHGWSKRRKLLSHALARGLWRWKDGYHARKRMKRCGAGGGRNSGSDKSSDRAPYGVHASDPSTAPTSKPGPFKWSDFPVSPTDSSGELFGGGSSNLMAEMHALGKDWTTCGCSRGAGDDTSGSRNTTDCDQCWPGSENPNAMESGYGSEPGYRGDEELEFGDIDEEQDEEETEPQHLRIWTQVMTRTSSHARAQAQVENLDIHEAFQTYKLDTTRGRGRPRYNDLVHERRRGFMQ